MPDISLLEFARFLGSDRTSGMAQKVGLKWPPPPSISVRNLVQLAGLPSPPTGLSLNYGGGDHPPDSQGVPVTQFACNWRDPGVLSPRAAKNFRFSLYTQSGVVVESYLTWAGTFVSPPLILQYGSSYSWDVVPQSQYTDGPGPIWGPSSPRYTFRTEPKPAPPPTKPSISVSSTGVGAGAVFTITGSGFVPNSTVTIRVVDESLNQRSFSQSAAANGDLNARISLPCTSGGTLHFSATDGRPDPTDLTGVLWSNRFDSPCP